METPMSTLLALDTATEACSVALLHDGKVTSHYEVIPRLHAQKLLPMIQQLLAEAGTTLQAVNAIAFGRGPGAFTGVRIAIGVVQGLAFLATTIAFINIFGGFAVSQRMLNMFRKD